MKQAYIYTYIYIYYTLFCARWLQNRLMIDDDQMLYGNDGKRGSWWRRWRCTMCIVMVVTKCFSAGGPYSPFCPHVSSQSRDQDETCSCYAHETCHHSISPIQDEHGIAANCIKPERSMFRALRSSCMRDCVMLGSTYNARCHHCGWDSDGHGLQTRTNESNSNKSECSLELESLNLGRNSFHIHLDDPSGIGTRDDMYS